MFGCNELISEPLHHFWGVFDNKILILANFSIIVFSYINPFFMWLKKKQGNKGFLEPLLSLILDIFPSTGYDEKFPILPDKTKIMV